MRGPFDPRAADRAAARAWHPAARSSAPDRRQVLQRLAHRAGRRGATWPRVAAAVVLLRGVSGDDRVAFARRVGVSVAELADLEGGATAPSDVPPRLRRVRGLVDWDWVDAGDQGFW